MLSSRFKTVLHLNRNLSNSLFFVTIRKKIRKSRSFSLPFFRKTLKKMDSSNWWTHYNQSKVILTKKRTCFLPFFRLLNVFSWIQKLVLEKQNTFSSLLWIKVKLFCYIEKKYRLARRVRKHINFFSLFSEFKTINI